MGRTELIAEAERDLADAERRHAEAEEMLVDAQARVAGARARLSALRASVKDPGALASLSRTDAIVAVLRQAAEPLKADSVGSVLVAGGRPADTTKIISATLSHLAKQGTIQRVGRGEYTAV